MRTQSVDTTPEAERVLIELIRKAPIAKRFELVRSLTTFAIRLKASFSGLHLESMLRVNIHTLPFDTFVAEMYQRANCYALTKDSKALRIASLEDIVLIQLVEYKANGAVADDCWNEILGILKVQKGIIELAYLKQWAITLDIDILLKNALEDAGINE